MIWSGCKKSRRARRNCSITFVAAAMLSATTDSDAADFTGYLVLTSDYVYRGVTYSDGDIAGQLGGDLSFDSGLYFGAWASTIDISNGPARQRDTEIKYYVGYSHDFGRNWSFGANLVAFTFPGAEGNIDYDYEEFTVSANYRDSVWLEYSYSPDIYNTGQSTQNLALLAEWRLANQFRLSAGVGYYDVSELTGSGYTYWQAGISRQLGVFDIDLRYHGTSSWVPIVSTADRADDRVALSLRYQF
jgi:uncharacterized protein (TIGR02001 family)